jgi:hypothetical protein
MNANGWDMSSGWGRWWRGGKGKLSGTAYLRMKSIALWLRQGSRGKEKVCLYSRISRASWDFHGTRPTMSSYLFNSELI